MRYTQLTWSCLVLSGPESWLQKSSSSREGRGHPLAAFLMRMASLELDLPEPQWMGGSSNIISWGAQRFSQAVEQATACAFCAAEPAAQVAVGLHLEHVGGEQRAT